MNRLALVLVLAAALAACGGTDRGGARPLTVLAAASLTEAVGDEAKAFAAGGAPAVRTSFAGSQTLVAQVEAGARADVVLTADEASMDQLRGDLAGAPRTFARNRLVIAVARGNPRHVRALRDLARPGLVVVLADRSVPAGRYAYDALRRAGVTVHPRSLEESVRGVLTRVSLGEADAGVVYATDVTAADGRVDGVPIPEALAPPTSYVAGVVKGSAHGGEFVDYLLSAPGQAILRRHGFLAPS